MSDPQNTRGVPGEAEEADTASGGPPERADGTAPEPETADGAGDEESADEASDDGH